MKKRLISLLAPGIIALSLLLSACGSSAGTAPELLVLNGESVAQSWILKLGGEEVPPDEYRYYFMNLKYQLSGGSGDFEWTEARAAQLKSMTLEYIKVSHALNTLAAQKGVSLSEADEAELAEQRETEISESGGRDEFLKSLTSSYMTERYYGVLLRTQRLQEKLESAMFSEGGEFYISETEMKGIISRDYISVRYVMLEYTDDTKAEKKALAEQLLERIRGGEEFSDIVNEYSDDSMMIANPYGTYIARGMTGQALEDACFGLEIGGMSGVVDGEGGFFIIKRLEKDSAYVDENIEKLKSYHMEHVFSLKLKEIVDGMAIEENPEIYPLISVSSMG